MTIQATLDRLYMAAALNLAERGLFTVTRGNPRVGCLLVKDNQVIGRGWHEYDGGNHAEVNALNDVGGSTRGATAYVTLEPCSFEGRTQACTAVLINAGIKRAVIGSRDPHPKVKGQGIASLEENGIEVKIMGFPVPGELNPGVFRRFRNGRPFVRIKAAISMDGRTALASGKSQWITSERARKDVQYWRARSGAIMTGIGTVLADDPKLTVREPEYQESSPWRVVLDNQGRFPANAAMLKDNVRTIIVCGRDAHGAELAKGLDVWHENTATIGLKSVLSRLADEGVNELLVEAGSELVGTFVKARLWDEMVVYLAPKLMGSTARGLAAMDIAEMAMVPNAKVISITELEPDIRVVLRRG